MSTFLSEMIEVSAIINSATRNSLVLIDELGRGTSTYEGFGLAWEVARYLACTKRCFTLFATHFHELGDLADELPPGSGVFNSHVAACVAASDVVFLFEVKPGCADLSYGIKVAEMARIHPAVIAKAKEKVEELEAAEARMVKRKRDDEDEEYDRDGQKKMSKGAWSLLALKEEDNNNLLNSCESDNDGDGSVNSLMKSCFDNVNVLKEFLNTE